MVFLKDFNEFFAVAQKAIYFFELDTVDMDITYYAVHLMTVDQGQRVYFRYQAGHTSYESRSGIRKQQLDSIKLRRTTFIETVREKCLSRGVAFSKIMPIDVPPTPWNYTGTY